MKIIQIKGGNGSGKTTICKQLLEFNNNGYRNAYTLINGAMRNGDRAYAMYLADIGYVLIGEYSLDKTMGGTDVYPSKVADIKTAIKAAIELATTDALDVYAIIFEGMMISTIKSTFYNYLLELEDEYGIDPLFVILKTSPDGCMDRIANRPSKRVKKVPNFDNISNKSAIVVRHAKTYDQKYVRYLDVENIAKEDMLEQFLIVVNDVDMLRELHLEMNDT